MSVIISAGLFAFFVLCIFITNKMISRAVDLHRYGILLPAFVIFFAGLVSLFGIFFIVFNAAASADPIGTFTDRDAAFCSSNHVVTNEFIRWVAANGGTLIRFNSRICKAENAEHKIVYLCDENMDIKK